MVYLLVGVAQELLEQRRLQGGTGPHHGPVTGFLAGNIPETIVFQGVSDYFDIVFIKPEVIATIGGLVRLDTHRIFVRAENQKLLLHFIRNNAPFHLFLPLFILLPLVFLALLPPSLG